MLNTLVHNQPVNKGLHWAMFVPTVEHDPLQALGKTNYEHKGLSIDPYINTNS